MVTPPPIQLHVRGAELPAGAARRLARTLATTGMRIMRARLTLTDDNGPKGGRALRCSILLSLPGRAQLDVEYAATTSRLALDGALNRLAQRLARLHDVARDSRRRPG